MKMMIEEEPWAKASNSGAANTKLGKSELGLAHKNPAHKLVFKNSALALRL